MCKGYVKGLPKDYERDIKENTIGKSELVRSAMKRMKRKAGGENGIATEMLESLGGLKRCNEQNSRYR